MPYGENLLTNPSGEAGDTSGWSASNVTVENGGTEGLKCFRFLATASLEQVLGAQAYPPVFLFSGDFLPDEAWDDDPHIGAQITLFVLYQDGKKDAFVIPMRTEVSVSGNYKRASAVITANEESAVTGLILRAATKERAGRFDNFVLKKNTAITGAGGVTSFYQPDQPAANAEGDLWIDTDDNNKLYRWDGSQWVLALNSVRHDVNYGGFQITATGVENVGQVANEAMFDKYGINPFYIRRYPNKCWNSSFEGFDKDTKKPHFWSGGVSDSAAAYDGTYSLKLTNGEASQQEEVDGVGMADPAWWVAITPYTRVSFKQKAGPITVSVHRKSDNQALTLTDENGNTGSSITYASVLDWATGHRTFKVNTSSSPGKIYIKFVAGGDVYIDAVDIGPDFTGKWPPYYADGPKSIGAEQVAFDPAEGGGGEETQAVMLEIQETLMIATPPEVLQVTLTVV